VSARPLATEADLTGDMNELVVLSTKDLAARCRVVGAPRELTVRVPDALSLVPGEIMTLEPRKRWQLAGRPFVSGTVIASRLTRPLRCPRHRPLETTAGLSPGILQRREILPRGDHAPLIQADEARAGAPREGQVVGGD